MVKKLTVPQLLLLAVAVLSGFFLPCPSVWAMVVSVDNIKFDGDVGVPHFIERFGKDALVVLGQPLPRLRIWDRHTEPLRVEIDVAGRSKPGGEAVAVDLTFHTGQNLIPEICRHRSSPTAG